MLVGAGGLFPVAGVPALYSPAPPTDRLDLTGAPLTLSDDPWKNPDHYNPGPVTSAPAPAPPPRPADTWKQAWQNQVLYQIVTDRFSDGDTANDYLVDRSRPAGWWGGDLRGVIDKLDYIKDLGATALWISPVYENTQQLRLGEYEGTGYHGYWIHDHQKVERHQGDLDTLKELVRQAHQRGLKVVLDVVLNHVGPDHPWVRDPRYRDWFHPEMPVRDWNDPYQVENGWVLGLPDLAQENPRVYDFLLQNTLWWIRETGVDGIRLDALKHVPKEFWSRFAADLKRQVPPDFLILGEVLHGDPQFDAPYQRAGVDALFDFPLYYTLTEVFARDGSAEALGWRLDQDGVYPDASKLFTFIDNHDVPRFLHEAGPGGRQKLKLALAFLMTCRGIPTLYYGTEVGLQGGPDPDNRRLMEFGSDPELTEWVRRLTTLRQSQPALQFGRQLEMWRDHDVYAFARQYQNQEVVAAFNNSYSDQTRRIPLRAETVIPPGATLRDVLSGQRFPVRDGHLELNLPAKSARILVVERP
ncbi:MAG TPA: alpha-amylase family glycosyl hydrolase [Candidatus Nitrosotenuis sp.]|jgi:alpha-amylase|nr:alpha-amylase family glycosyl hydrolase [Candidatus Nitrosotenuis sp.]